MRVDWCVSSWFRIKNTHSLTTQGGHGMSFFVLSLAFDVRKQSKADMAYRSRAHRHPAHPPPPARAHPGREKGE